MGDRHGQRREHLRRPSASATRAASTDRKIRLRRQPGQLHRRRAATSRATSPRHRTGLKGDRRRTDLDSSTAATRPGSRSTTRGGPNNGYIYFTPTFDDTASIYAFKPNGEYAGLILDAVGFSCQALASTRPTATSTRAQRLSRSSALRRRRRTSSGALPNGTLPRPNRELRDSPSTPAATSTRQLRRIRRKARSSNTRPRTSARARSPRTRNLRRRRRPASPTTRPAATSSPATAPTCSELTTGGCPVNAPFGGLDNSRGRHRRAPATGSRHQPRLPAGGSIDVFGPPASLPMDTTEPASEVLQTTRDPERHTSTPTDPGRSPNANSSGAKTAAIWKARSPARRRRRSTRRPRSAPNSPALEDLPSTTTAW